MPRVPAPRSKKTRSRLGMGRVLAAALVAASVFGCSGSTEPPTQNAAPSRAVPKKPLDPLAPGASIVCGSGATPEGHPEIEMYMVYAMNQKLRQFPDFASALGTDLISDCEGARHYAETYGEYLKRNPGFDATESLGQLPSGQPLPADAEQPPSVPEDVPKVLFGSTVTRNPVVRILSPIPNTAHPDWDFGTTTGSLCTGTFINKNWILTAGHCLTLGAVHHCLKDGTKPLDCVPEWENYSTEYTISGTRGPASNTTWSLKALAVRGYVHPNWIGRNMTMNPTFCPNQVCPDLRFPQGGKWDLGLLYVPSHFYDDELPPDIEEDGALRLSTHRHPDVANWPMAFYGYGMPVVPSPPQPLRRGTMILHGTPELVQDPRWEDYAGFLIRGVLPPFGTPGNHQRPCSGDSGGPLVRTGVSIQRDGTILAGREVIVGVYSFSKKPCALPADDQSWRAYEAGWVRVDEPMARDFIEGTMQETNWPPYSKLDCTPRSLTSAPAEPPVLECWGKRCMVDSDCKDNSGVKKVCAFSGRYFAQRQASCTACGVGGSAGASGGGCDCIWGQCAPAP
jgi:hypothetical protein